MPVYCVGGADPAAGPGAKVHGESGLYWAHLPGRGPGRLLQGPGAQPAPRRARHHDHLCGL